MSRQQINMHDLFAFDFGFERLTFNVIAPDGLSKSKSTVCDLYIYCAVKTSMFICLMTACCILTQAIGHLLGILILRVYFQKV